jgi:hypothetical protein
MTMSSISPVPSALTSQLLQGQSGAHRSRGGSEASQSQTSTQISPLSSLMNALSSSSSTGLSTMSSLVDSLSGFSSSTSATNILV